MTDRLHHLGVFPEQLGKYCILPGDPKRVKLIAAYLDNPQLTGDFREYTSYTGTLCGVKVSVVSTGIGGPSAAIAAEELSMAGVHTIIRVGTCGALQEELIPGTLIVPTGAVRSEGTADSYLPKDFPAVADFTVVTALLRTVQKLDYECRTGVVDSKDSYYGQHCPESMPYGEELSHRMSVMGNCGVLASEMECAALFIVSAVRHIRTAAILMLCSNVLREKKTGDKTTCFDTDRAIRTAVEAIKILIEKDGKGAEKND